MFAMDLLPTKSTREEQLVPDLDSVFSHSPDRYNFSDKSPKMPLYHDLRFSCKQRRKAFYRQFIVFFLLIAISALLKCHLVSLKLIKAGAFARRLAAGEEEGEKDLLQSIMEICGIIPGSKISLVENEEVAPPTLPPELPAGFFKATTPEREESQKTKRDATWLDSEEMEPLPEPLKKARVLQPPLPEEVTITIPEEEPVAGPSHASLQGAASMSVSESPILVLQMPEFPPAPTASKAVQLCSQPVWGQPPAAAGSATILQEPDLYVSAQQIQGITDVVTTGESLAAQAPVAKELLAEAQLPSGCTPIVLVNSGEVGGPAVQPQTTVSVVPGETGPFTTWQQPVLQEREYAHVMLLAQQMRDEGAEYIKKRKHFFRYDKELLAHAVGLQPLSFLSSSGVLLLVDPLIVATGGIRVSFCPLLQAGAAEVTVIVLPPTATAGRSSPPRPPALELHPFYRLPLGHTGGALPLFDHAAALAAPAGAQLAFALKLLRPLLLKDLLNQDELKVLQNCAYLLVGYSSKWSVTDFEDMPPWCRLGPLAYRLLAADALWCICDILGPSVMRTDEWWENFMDRVAVPCTIIMGHGDKRPPPHVRDLLPKFLHALEMFKERQRPPPELLVELKRRIFRTLNVYTKFKRRVWNLWRADDDEFQ